MMQIRSHVHDFFQGVFKGFLFGGRKRGEQPVFKADDFTFNLFQQLRSCLAEVKVLHAFILLAADTPQQAALDQARNHADKVGGGNPQCIANLALIDAMIAVNQHQNREIHRTQGKICGVFDKFPVDIQFRFGELVTQQVLQS